jgi:hypothetical protein
VRTKADEDVGGTDCHAVTSPRSAEHLCPDLLADRAHGIA